MMVSRAAAGAALAVVVTVGSTAVLLEDGGSQQVAPPRPASRASPHSGHAATCAAQSSATFPGAFAARENLRVGPLVMVGARRFTPPATVKQLGGNKFPVLVKAGHRVTIGVPRRASRSASLFYGTGGGVLTQTRVSDGHPAITFRACSRREAASDVDGDPVTFWSGFVVVSEAMCVRLAVWIDADPKLRRARIPLGRHC